MGVTDGFSWMLEIVDDEGQRRVVPMTQSDVVIGRSVESTVQLDWPTVSRRHARLSRRPDGRWIVCDLSSRSGTFVNQQKVEEATLHLGDVIGISRYNLRLLDNSPAPPRRSPGSRSTWAAEPGGPDAAAAEISVLTHIAPPKLDITQITALHEFGRELMNVDSAQDRLTRLCEVITGETIHARWVMALRLDADDPTHPPEQLAIHPPETIHRTDVHISRSTIRAMQQSRAPVLASNFRQDAGVVEMSIVSKAPATAVVACPLSDDPASHDLIYVNLPPAFGSTEWLALIALAVKQYQQAESAWVAREAIRVQAAMERDLANARQIQRSILPPVSEVLPGAAGLDVAWSFEPCDLIGGDYIDVVPMPDGRVLLAIADVTGHGLPAALATLAVHSIVHTCLRSGMTMARMMTILNDHLCDYLPNGRFVTMLGLAIDPRNGYLECLNAGHQPPLIFGADGQVRAMPPSDHYPLGLERFEFEPQRDALGFGETLLLLTDGITELHLDSGEELGLAGAQRLIGELIAQSGSDLHKLIAGSHDKLTRLHGDRPSLDDQTFLVARRQS